MRSALLATLCLAAASHASPFDDRLKSKTESAALLSKSGQYEAAATTLSKWVEGEGKELEAKHKGGDWRLKDVLKLAEIYAARAELAKIAGTDAKAARQLLLELLRPSRAEVALISDARITELLKTLRKLDPKAKDFFTPRKVKVVITGGLEGARADELAVAMVEQLRPLGFEASTAEGSETLTLESSMGKELDVSSEMSGASGGLNLAVLGGKGVKNMISCELIVHAKWMAGGVEVLRTDLGSRAPGFSDIPNSCVKAAIKNVATKSGPRVIEAWNAQ